MMGIKTLIIAPYSGLKELTTQLSQEQRDLDVTVLQGDLREAIPIIKQYEQKGIQYIISRGGTASLIRQHTAIPVVEIPVSGYDILRALTLVKDYKMTVEMIGFQNICQGVLSVAHLLDINIPYTIIQSEGDVQDAIRDAAIKGAQIILGDTVTVNTAEKYGLQGMLITSGKESVLDAFNQVKQINEIVNHKERKDQDLKVTIRNEVNISFAQIVTNSKIMKETISRAKKLISSPKLTLIHGEKGSGKKFVSTAIHKDSVFNKNDFIEVSILNVQHNTLEQLNSLLASPIKGTLYIKGFELLGIEDQKSFISNLMELEAQIILSFKENPEELGRKNQLYTYILKENVSNILGIPSLQERQGDFEEYIRIFIANYNTVYGKQVVGIRQNVLDKLYKYEWPDNLEGLKRTVEELVKNSNGNYIEEELLYFVEEPRNGLSRNTFPIDLSRTLVEIEKDIILHVLKEENMNQTSAAQRLGINRTTLWRKLK
jgi:DNA-binding NtrC family response regulator